MHTPPTLPPESGERVFRYVLSRLIFTALSSILFGIFFTGIAGFITYAILTEKSKENLVIPLIGGLLFIAVGLGVITSGVFHLLALANERLIHTPSEVVWIDRYKRERIRCKYGEIVDAQQTTLSQESSSRYSPMHHRCIVTTTHGEIRFSDNIDEYRALLDFFVAHRIAVAVEGEFRYKSKAIFGIAAFVIPLTLFMTVTFWKGYIDGEPIKDNGVIHKMDISSPLMVTGMSSVFWLVVIFGFLQRINEKITIGGGRLTHYNLFGKAKVNVPLNWIERGSFTESSSSRSGIRYSIATPQGRVKWNDQISNCTDLLNILQTASNADANSQASKAI